MSLNRQSLKIVTEALADVDNILSKSLGDLENSPGNLLPLEVALCRLRGSTDFHDTNYAKDFLQFNEPDTINFGIQNSFLTTSNTYSNPFPTIPSMDNPPPWNPMYYGPPAPEGWYIHQYNGWAGYQINPLINPLNSMGEPNSNQRLQYNFPVRYNGTDYSRVEFWQNARYVSVLNNLSSSLGTQNQIQIDIKKEDFYGFKITNQTNDLPVDLKIYSSPQLLQQGNPSTGSWSAVGNLPSTGTVLESLPFLISQSNTSDAYTLNINLPSGLTSWNASYYLHLIFYWGSLDNYSVPTQQYNSVPNNVSGLPVYFWPKKSFFNNEVSDTLSFTSASPMTWLNSTPDNSTYLYLKHRTHYSLEDGTYSQLSQPVRYSLEAFTEDFNTVSIPDDCAQSCLCVVLTHSDGSCENQFIFGPIITPEFFPANWEDFNYFPKVPEYCVEIARVIISNAPDETKGLNEQQNKNNNSIVWFKQSVPTFALPPIGNAMLSLNFLPILKSIVDQFRQINFDAPILTTAFNLIAPNINFPSYLASGVNSFTTNTSLPSQVFHGLLKNPMDAALLPTDSTEPLAITFSSQGISLINKLTKLPPSTEIMRLDGDNLYITNESIPVPSQFELYMEPQDTCDTVDDPTNSGTSIGQDYTFRIIFEDGDQNTLTKDWFIMASKYFLTQQEYDNQILTGSTSGYFTASTLQNIDQFRLYGYAAVVPDLVQGSSVLVTTRVVSPPDGTKTTKAQFDAQELSRGIAIGSEQYINDIEDNFPDGFYNVDLDQYSNLFTKIKSVSLSVTHFSYGLVSYWQENLNTNYPLYSDSFIVAPSGYLPGDLENGGNLILGSFNRTDLRNFPPPNTVREVPGVYIQDGTWAFTADKLIEPQTITIYPKSTVVNGNHVYLPYKNNIFVIIRLIVNGEIEDAFLTLPQGSNTPVMISANNATGIVYLAVGKSMSSLQTSTHGSPPGDRLVIRSV